MATSIEAQIAELKKAMASGFGVILTDPNSAGNGKSGSGGSGSGSGSGIRSSETIGNPGRVNLAGQYVQYPVGEAMAIAYARGLLQPEYEEVLDYNFGWNTRAHYDFPISPGDTIRFRIPAYSTGVVAGLTLAPKDFGYDDIEFGVYQHRIAGAAVHGGVDDRVMDVSVNMVRSGAIYEPMQPEVSAYEESGLADLRNGDLFYADIFPTEVGESADTHELKVFIDRVEYWNRYPSGSGYLFYTAYIPFSIWTFSVALFGGGDKVWAVEVIPATGSADIQLPTIAVFASDVADYTGTSIVLPGITVEAADFIESVTANIAMPGLAVFGGEDITYGDVPLPLLTVQSLEDSGGIPAIDITFGYVALPRLGVQAFSLDVSKASADISLPRLAVFASDVADLTIGDVALLDPIDIWSYTAVKENHADMVEFAFGMGAVLAFEAYYIVWTERLGVVGLMSALQVERALLQANITHQSSMSANEILQALLASSMTASDMASIAGETLQVWAMHMDAGGSTRYENFNFNSFANIDGITYGASESGIYRLDGNKDDGADIQQLVDFGRLSFGTNSRKGLPYVYAGMAADGPTFLRVVADGATFTYQVRNSTENMATHRFELGRGLRASFYDVSLISSASSFDLHNIEFMPIELTRRL